MPEQQKEQAQSTFDASLGMDRLLAAEKKFAENVQKARNEKDKRINEAREEANVILRQFREACDVEFEEKRKEIGDRSRIQKEIDDEMAIQINKMKAETDETKDETIKLLASALLNVEPRMHENYLIKLN